MIMHERSRRIPERIAENLINDYDNPIPKGSILVSVLREKLEAFYGITKNNIVSRNITSRILNRLHKSFFLSYVIKNPDSFKNKSTVRYLAPDQIEDILSFQSSEQSQRTFQNEEQLKILQHVIKTIVANGEALSSDAYEE
jgi:hypothetical protein